MRINFESGHVVQEVILETLDEKKSLPVDFEILDVGLKEGKVTLFGVSKNQGQVHEKNFHFVVFSSGKGLPKLSWQYYWYVGTIARKGLHIFEVI